MSNLRTCDHCGETFETITECKLHQDDCDLDPGDELVPDYNDPVSPERNGDREMRCLHCRDTLNESTIVYEKRHGHPHALWYCPNEDCDRAGVGIDLHVV